MVKVVVIGRNYTSRLGMIRMVGKAGYPVYVICTNRRTDSDLDKSSKYVCGYYSAKEPDRSKLMDKIWNIGKMEKGIVILIPVDDYAAAVIDDNMDTLKDRFLFPNVDMHSGSINALMDKNTQKRLARIAGLNVAKGWVVEVKDGRYLFPEGVLYPCFPKPQISFLGTKQYMAKCSTKEELRTALDKCAKLGDCPILVEQFIDIEKEYGVLGCCDKGRSLIPGLVEKNLIGEGAHKGVTKIGCVTPLANHPKLYDCLTKFLAQTHFTGLCDIDLYESKGIIYFNELNLRFGAFGYAIMCAGANLPACLIDILLGKNIDFENFSIRPRTICLSEKVNLEDYQAGYYEKNEYDRIKRAADFTFIKDKDDPKPYFIFRKRVWETHAKKCIKKVLQFVRWK